MRPARKHPSPQDHIRTPRTGLRLPAATTASPPSRRPGLLLGVVGIAAIGLGGVGGCIPDPPPSFASLAPNDRLTAIVRAADQTDHESLQGLVGQLESDDPAARLLASTALRQRTGETFGYLPEDPAWRREPAVQRWRDFAVASAPPTPATPPTPAASSSPGSPAADKGGPDD